MNAYKLLLIDDEPVSEVMLRAVLQGVDRSDFHIDWKGTYQEGLDALTQNTYDACLLDYQLGVETGIDLLHSIRHHQLDTPIIMVSGMPDAATDLEAISAGAADFLSKNDFNGPLIERCIRFNIERKVQQDLLQKLANQDPLTELPNRLYFSHFIDDALERAQRYQRMVAVLFVDIDYLKSVNDSCGHSIGDELIIQFSQRLRTAVRSTDLVARIGGDEFAVVLDAVETQLVVERVGESILTACAEPFEIADRRLEITASVGIALYPDDGQDVDTLLSRADTAMYAVKHGARNRYQFYSDTMQTLAVRHSTLEKVLIEALNEDRLLVYYQPLVKFPDNTVQGVEALLRVPFHSGEFANTQELINVAERSNLIKHIGDKVLQIACREFSRENRAKDESSPTLSINISMRQLRHADFLQIVNRSIAESGIEAHQLVFELTETSLMDSPERVIEIVRELKRVGVSVVVDDFGTGQSSLSYLADLPVDGLKIDKSFVLQYFSSEKHATIVKTIISMAHNLGLSVVAEGVEDQRTADTLIGLGCEVLQGFHFSRAVPLAELSNRTEELTPV